MKVRKRVGTEEGSFTLRFRFPRQILVYVYSRHFQSVVVPREFNRDLSSVTPYVEDFLSNDPFPRDQSQPFVGQGRGSVASFVVVEVVAVDRFWGRGGRGGGRERGSEGSGGFGLE